MVFQCLTHSTVSSKTHLGTKDFKKFWEVLALLFCFRFRGLKTRAWCGSRSLTGVRKKGWKTDLILTLHVVDWGL